MGDGFEPLPFFVWRKQKGLYLFIFDKDERVLKQKES